MAFEDTKSDFRQEHFTIVEIDLPTVEGTCTLGSSNGYGTPLTCDQPSNATKTYKFTTKDAPLIAQSEVWRCIANISETPTKLRSGRGLASRGSINIRFDDFKGDPNPLAPGVNETVINQGSFLAKLAARNIMQNRNVRIKNYRIGDDGAMPDLDNDAQTRHYIIESFSPSGAGKFTLIGKDELSRVNLDEKLWPEANNGFLRGSISDSQTTGIQVDPDTTYTTSSFIRIGEEIIDITAVSNIGTPSATIEASFRGSTVIGSLTWTEISSHDAGDEIFLCRAYTNAKIYTVLYDILTESGVDPSIIPLSDWQAEIDLWHASTTIDALYVESRDVNEVIGRLLQSYMLDMWFDPVDREIKISAISAWQASSKTLTEGNEINYDSVKVKEVDELRATDALIVFDKRYKARDDSTENFKQAVAYSNPVLTTSDYYGEAKQKRFDNNPIIDGTAADLLTRRYVARYGITPVEYEWETEEKKLNFNVGDVVDLRTYAKLGFDGLPSSTARAQITSIKPNYSRVGRNYKVSALTYQPALGLDGVATEIVLAGLQSEVNLYIEAGAPAEPVEVTFIFDGVTGGANSANNPAVRAGGFPSGSKIIMILANGADLQGAGGFGANGGIGVLADDGSGTYNTPTPNPGQDGGVVYDAEGVTTDIYFSGATPSANYPTANGYIRAPGGGGGAEVASQTQGGDAGSGGAGRTFGVGGNAGFLTGSTGDTSGLDGNNGNESGVGGAAAGNGGFGGDWGQAGGSSSSAGGAAGKGVVDSGATVTFFGSSASRYINGGGDH